MGPKSSTNASSTKQVKEEIGKGGFGKVWKVQSKKFKKQYAMKEMSKAKVIDKKSEKSIKYERELLSRLKHPFLVNMQYAFQDYENLFLVMDLLTGGDLRYHVSRHKRFSEEQTKYLHINNVLHRDIKPENLVLDERGYVRITDFGIAKLYQKENSSETSGTPGYMSPEVMCAQNHTIGVDYFALGVIAYEFMNGRRPYVGRTRKEIKEQIMAKQVQVKINEVPEGWSEEAADFTNRLLQRKPAHRLGIKGAQEVKDHPWLKYYPWTELYDKTLEAPFVPKIGDNFDRKYCESQDKLGNSTQERYQKYMRDENFTSVFQNFTYINYNEASQFIVKEEASVNNTQKTNSVNHTPFHQRAVSSSSTNKLMNQSSQKKYNINLLKSKVKIIDNSHSSKNIQGTTNITNITNIINVNNSNKSSKDLSTNQVPNTPINYTNQKIAQNVNSFYNNYIHHHSKSNSVVINSSSMKDITANMNSNQSGKFTPYREKKIEIPITTKKDFNYASKNSIGATSSTNLVNLNNRLFNQKLPNINNLDKLKLTKKLSGSSSNVNILKNYSKQSSSQNSTGSTINSSLKFFNK